MNTRTETATCAVDGCDVVGPLVQVGDLAVTLCRELMNLVERLSGDFRDSPVGTITRVVRSVAPPAGSCDLGDMNALVASLEVAARQSLTPLAWPAA